MRFRRSLVAAGLALLTALIACSVAVGGGVGEAGAADGTIAKVSARDKSEVFAINRDNLEATVKSGKWVVAFYVPWCKSCQALQPTLEDVAKELKGKVNVGKVNCSIERALCERFNVRLYPTVVHVDNQRARKYQSSTSLSKDALVAFALRDHLTMPTYSTIRAPFGPLESIKAVFLRITLNVRGMFLQQLHQGTPMWLLGAAAVAVLAVTTTAIACLLVVTSRPKED